jgi:hypothetical protein
MKTELNYLALILTSLSFSTYGQDPTNYNETKVPSYILTELRVSLDGWVIKSAREWMDIRI